jgi:hypothetical protein
LSGLPIFCDYDRGEEPGQQQLLALHKLWRSLERVPP